MSPPADWAKTGIQQGKTYDLQAGEGRRIFEECLERAKRSPHWNVESVAESLPASGPRFGQEILVRPRLGQGLFSLSVRDAYGGACAVTGEHSAPVLEAAHIRPYAEGGEHRIDNGLLLRRDLHRLFDLGYVTVTPDYVFHVGEGCVMNSTTAGATTASMGQSSLFPRTRLGGRIGSYWIGTRETGSKGDDVER